MKSQMMIDFTDGLAEASERMAVSFEDLASATKDVAKHLEDLALIIGRYRLDHIYFMAGGLSDLALMRGQPF
jgi:hypothetical protein